MIKTFTHNPGLSRSLGLRKGVAGLLAATFLVAFSGAAHADVFGGAAPSNGQSAALLERLTALERELKELKEKGVTSAPPVKGAPVTGKSNAQPAAGLKLTPPPKLPGLEGLPGGGVDERERLLVEKELTHEVVGTINAMLIVRDGEKRFVLTKDEYTKFEKKKREQVIHKMKVEAVTESGTRLNFPDLVPPPPPMQEGSELMQAGQVVDQARAIEANGGQMPPVKPAPAPVGQNKPASPVKKN